MAMLSAAAPAAHAEAARLSLPAPTGKQRVGTVSLHLVDRWRQDLLAPTARPRELMVRLWYPATRSHRPLAGYLTPRHSDVLVTQLNAITGDGHPADLLTFPTHSRTGAPAGGSRHPVVLLSPALSANAALHTGQAEELASRGYVVAAIDHTFDAGVVEFPGGRLEFENPDATADWVLDRDVRAADISFVLDQLTLLATGHNPDAERRRLPDGLARAINPTRVAVLGHSQGSIAAVRAMATDPRIDAGVALDGNPLGPASLDRPFLMIGNQHHRRADFPDWAEFYDQLRGPRLYLVIDGAEHIDFNDATVLKEDIDLGEVFSLGPIDGERSLTIQRRYVTAWLDHALNGRQSPLLTGESRKFPEVDF